MKCPLDHRQPLPLYRNRSRYDPGYARSSPLVPEEEWFSYSTGTLLARRIFLKSSLDVSTRAAAGNLYPCNKKGRPLGAALCTS